MRRHQGKLGRVHVLALPYSIDLFTPLPLVYISQPWQKARPTLNELLVQNLVNH